MKKLVLSLFVMAAVCCVGSSLKAQSDNDVERIDYLVVVANSTNKAENEKVLDQMKKRFKDAGMHYDESSKQYYVYIEKYYSKSGVDYAVWWHKKENKDLPKVWAKPVPVETN